MVILDTAAGSSRGARPSLDGLSPMVLAWRASARAGLQDLAVIFAKGSPMAAIWRGGRVDWKRIGGLQGWQTSTRAPAGLWDLQDERGDMAAGVFDALVSTGARLEASHWLEPGLGLASWRNCFDQTRYHRPGHHTLSVYLEGGEQTERLDGPGGHGGVGKICLMPDHHRSEWLVREEFRFFHLYFSPAHLMRIAEEVCDREGRHLQLDDKTFIDDAVLMRLANQLQRLDWQEAGNRLALGGLCNQLLLHTFSRHTQEAPPLVQPKGGLAPAAARRVCDYMAARLAQPILLGELAAEASLSEFHFSRMFAQTLGTSPHRYLQGLRLRRAKQLLLAGASLEEVASQCGFSSAAHLGNRFRDDFGLSPGQWRSRVSSNCHAGRG
jgi:AraC family transcriptional regulator